MTHGGFPPVSVVQLRDFTIESRWHTVSIADKTCTCDQFDASRGCEHLRAVGVHRLKPVRRSPHPTFSQALSALVKCIRVRRGHDAVYWLAYLDTFKDPQHRFRTARRLLIASAEDGHSVPVMEVAAERFPHKSKLDEPLVCLAREVVRICQLPNWWHADSGGHHYIYNSLVGEREWRYRRWDHSLGTLLEGIEAAIRAGDVATALGAMPAFRSVQEPCGATKQAAFLLVLAERMGHTLAERLCRVHLSARSALSGDNNFLSQAVWMMAGGSSPVADTLPSVLTGEAEWFLEDARVRWRCPKPVPAWCLDGVHSAGDDPRFMGMLPEMWAVCQAFNHYGRVSPWDDWLPQFRCFDGLIVRPYDERE